MRERTVDVTGAELGTRADNDGQTILSFRAPSTMTSMISMTAVLLAGSVIINSALFPFSDDVGGKGIFSLKHIKSIEDYEDEEYHIYSVEGDNDDEDSNGGLVFPTVTQHPNSVLPTDFEISSKKHPTTASTSKAVKKPAKKKIILTHPTFQKSNKLNSNAEKPKFTLDPVNSYVIRDKSAHLKCEVVSADKAYFVCNDEAMSESGGGLHKEVAKVDPESGLVVRSLSLVVTRNQVEEFFGQFSCRCDAWSSKGRVSSANVTVSTACKFEIKLQGFFCYADVRCCSLVIEGDVDKISKRSLSTIMGYWTVPPLRVLIHPY